jgi:uncharacterized membrane protein
MRGTADMQLVNQPSSVRQRITSIDVVRGFAIVFMALDHLRDYTTNLRFQPENMEKTTVALFATRWITHFCAPTFFLLAGVGIGLMKRRGMAAGDLSRFLLKRGVWLLFLELIITPIGWQFGFKLVPAFALVLWALGWSMIIMAALVHVPKRALLVISLITIFGHNLLDGVKPESFGKFAGLWHMLHVPGFIIPNVLFVGYPLIPWFAVMAIGYVLADVYGWEAERRRRALLTFGVATTILFIVVRSINHYGNPIPWAHQRTPGLTVASFLNAFKYPPSLDFLLMTLGPAMIALALVENARNAVTRFLAVFGGVPLFFYVVHIFVGQMAAILLAYAQRSEWHRIQVVSNPDAIPAWYGVPLWGVYLIWASVVLLLYWPCKRFVELKNTRRDWWLRYM